MSEPATNASIPLRSPHLRRVLQVIHSSIAGMVDEQMTWAPEGKWSSAHILEHLSLAFLVTTKGSRWVLRQAKPEIRAPTPGDHLRAFLVLKIGYFPFGAQAPKMVVPRGMSPQQAKDAILTNLIEMDRTLQQCEEKFGSNVNFMIHASLGPLTIRQWCKFSYLHTRHHMKQIRGLRRRMTGDVRAKSDGSGWPHTA
jgi:DinB superfamily